jgi:septum site-determining protein MinD
MLSKVIVVTSGKGGVGKTTTVANLGGALALLGRKTVVVDADIGLRNLDIVMGLENRIVFDIVNLVEGTCRFNQALIRDKKINNLFLIPAAQTRNKESVSPEQMREVCDKLKEEFDYVLIDSPAGIERGFQNSIAGADKALVVTTPHVSAVRDADRVIGLVEAHEKGTPDLIVNRMNYEMVQKGDMLDHNDIIDILAVRLIGLVPEDDQIVISSNKGELVSLDHKSPSGESFRRIARRLEGEDVPLMEFNNDSFIDKFKKFIGIKE